MLGRLGNRAPVPQPLRTDERLEVVAMNERLSEQSAGLRGASVRPYPPREPARLELRCVGCGFGAVTSATPTQCPMCGGLDWDFDDWRPFSSRGVEHD